MVNEQNDMRQWLGTEVISTLRLELRLVEAKDVPLVKQLWTDDLVRRHLGGPISPEKAQQRAEEHVSRAGYFCVTLRKCGAIIGICSLDKYRRYHTDDIGVSYQFFPELWGKGFGTEAIKDVLAWGFKSMDVDHIIAVSQKSNVRSRRLREKVGMSIVDEFKEDNKIQVMFSLNIDKSV